MSDIFISYSSADRATARQLAQALEQEGWSVWWDRTIQPGKSFSAVLEEALETARCVVVLWSPNSVASDWVQTEAAEGKRREILVPALIEEAELPLEFKRIQAANLLGWPEPSPDLEFDQCLQAIRAVLSNAEPGSDQSRFRAEQKPYSNEKQVTKRSAHRWYKGTGARTALLTLVSGVGLVGLFKGLFPQTPVSEAITMLALLALMCGAGLSFGWSYFVKKRD